MLRKWLTDCKPFSMYKQTYFRSSVVPLRNRSQDFMYFMQKQNTSPVGMVAVKKDTSTLIRPIKAPTAMAMIAAKKEEEERLRHEAEEEVESEQEAAVESEGENADEIEAADTEMELTEEISEETEEDLDDMSGESDDEDMENVESAE